MWSLQGRRTKWINCKGTQVMAEQSGLLRSFGSSFMKIVPVEWMSCKELESCLKWLQITLKPVFRREKHAYRTVIFEFNCCTSYFCHFFHENSLWAVLKQTFIAMALVVTNAEYHQGLLTLLVLCPEYKSLMGSAVDFCKLGNKPTWL